jgi:hypothetical protein
MSDETKIWKYNSLKDDEVWSSSYEFLPNDIIVKITECIVNKRSHTSHSKRSMDSNREISFPQLRNWIVLKQVIPRDIALRLSIKLSNRDLRRLQLAKPVAFAITQGFVDRNELEEDLIPQPGESIAMPVNQQQTEVLESESTGASEFVADATYDPEIADNDESLSKDSSESSDEYVRPEDFTDSHLQNVPTIRFDQLGNEIDPITGFLKVKPSFPSVVTHWLANELAVPKAAGDRLLALLRRYQPEITRLDYVENNILAKSESLLKKKDCRYVIRDFRLYDLKLDEFQDETEHLLSSSSSDDDDESENGVANNPAELVSSGNGLEDDEVESDNDRTIEIVVQQERPDNEDEMADCDDEDDDEVESPNKPVWTDYVKDINDFMKTKAKKEGNSTKLNHKMVYFGLENILTFSNSAGNIQKCAFVNCLRAIALLDENALTDEIVDRLFPKNSKVRMYTY